MGALAAISGVSLQAVIVGGIVLVTVLFGAIWTIVNFYTYFPLVQLALDTVEVGIGRRLRGRERESTTAAPDSYPSMDVLIPAYDEGNVIEQSIGSVLATEYPGSLTVSVVVEEGDDATKRALDALRDRYEFDTVAVPESYPGSKNKPRALNYGFEVTDAEVVGIVDAEDIVDPSLPRSVAEAMAAGADYTLSRLDMVNEDDGWLNLLFRAEYGYWYEQVIPAFTHVGYPVPLGGTACFFRRSVLRDASDARIERYGSPWTSTAREWLADHGLDGAVPWDPTNVTEDFELGLFLWLEEYEFSYVDVTTREESPLGLQSWLAQRTRWNKGKILTFRHFLRYKPETRRQRFHVYFQSMLPHLGPVNILGLVFVLWLANMAGAVPSALVGGVLALGMTFNVIVAALFARGYWRTSDAPVRLRIRRAATVAISLFLYWFLQWIADVRALIQVYHGDTTWEKTVHVGRNTVTNAASELDEAASGLVSSVERIQRPVETRTRRLALGGILVVATLLRVTGLTQFSLWIDEVYTVTFRATLPVRELLFVPYDPHPPLYFLLMKGWLALTGETHAAAAGFSVLFSVAAVAAMYVLARELYDDSTALLSALLLAVSTMHVHFGRNVRMYSAFTFFVLVSWYAFVRLGERSRRVDALYVLSTAAVLYTHVYGLFVVLAEYVYVALVETDRETIRSWNRLQFVLLALFLPWGLVLGGQVLGLFTGSGTAAVGWIPEPSTALVRDTLLMFAGFPSYYPVLAGTRLTWGLAMLVLFTFNVVLPFAAMTYRLTDTGYEFVLADSRQAGMLGVFVLALVGIPLAVSYLLVPVFYPRYTIAASLPLLVLVARAITNLPDRRWRVGIVLFLVVTSGVTTATYYQGESVEDWRGTAGVLGANAQPGDAIVIQPFWVEGDLDYYYDGPPLDRTLVEGSGFLTDENREAVCRVVETHDRVWLLRYQATADDEGLLDRFAATHESTLTVYDGLISLTLYEPGDADGGEPGPCASSQQAAMPPHSALA